MSMKDIRTDIEFGVVATNDREQIKSAQFDIIKHTREYKAQDLGLLIAEKKGWNMWTEGDLLISELRLFVFTPNELRDYIDAKLKQGLIQMANRDVTSPELKEQLLMLSERV